MDIEMSIFDSLPRELRDILNYAPVSFTGFPMQAASALYRGAAVGHIAAAIQAAVFKECPGWAPLREPTKQRRIR